MNRIRRGFPWGGYSGTRCLDLKAVGTGPWGHRRQNLHQEPINGDPNQFPKASGRRCGNFAERHSGQLMNAPPRGALI
jgi:hypothetical protein